MTGRAERSFTKEQLGVSDSILALANGWVRRARHRRYRRTLQEFPDRLRVVATGDTWFQHPFVSDVVDQVSDHVAVYHLGGAGTLRTSM